MPALDVDRALARWMPRLVAVWRRHRKLPPGPPTLVGRELKEVGQGIRTLSTGLTRDRALVGARYLDDPRLLGAYLLFYWPVSYAQARAVLGELPRRPRAVLDLGSGPGPVAFAALDAGASEVTAADRSAPALTLARALAAEAEEPLATPCLERRCAPRRNVRRHHSRARAERARARAFGARRAGGVAGAGRGAAPARRLSGGARAGAPGHLAGAPPRPRPARCPRIRRPGPLPVAGRVPGAGEAIGLVPRRADLVSAAAARCAGAGGRAAQGGAQDELPRARAAWRGVAGAAAGTVVPHRLRAARGERPPALHGLRTRGESRPGAPGEAPDGGERELLLASPRATWWPWRGRSRGGTGSRSSRGARSGRSPPRGSRSLPPRATPDGSRSPRTARAEVAERGRALRARAYLTPFAGSQAPCILRRRTICPVW